jgi:hypothetical protein
VADTAAVLDAQVSLGDLVVYFVGEPSPCVVGQSFRIDGGYAVV